MQWMVLLFRCLKSRSDLERWRPDCYQWRHLSRFEILLLNKFLLPKRFTKRSRRTFSSQGFAGNTSGQLLINQSYHIEVQFLQFVFVFWGLIPLFQAATKLLTLYEVIGRQLTILILDFTWNCGLNCQPNNYILEGASARQPMSLR